MITVLDHLFSYGVRIRIAKPDPRTTGATDYQLHLTRDGIPETVFSPDELRTITRQLNNLFPTRSESKIVSEPVTR